MPLPLGGKKTIEIVTVDDPGGVEAPEAQPYETIFLIAESRARAAGVASEQRPTTSTTTTSPRGPGDGPRRRGAAKEGNVSTGVALGANKR